MNGNKWMQVFQFVENLLKVGNLIYLMSTCIYPTPIYKMEIHLLFAVNQGLQCDHMNQGHPDIK